MEKWSILQMQKVVGVATSRKGRSLFISCVVNKEGH